MELIKIEQREIVAGQMVDTVNARDLWTFVESKQQFTDWLFNRLDKYHFVAEEDYLIHKVMKQINGKSDSVRSVISVEYYLTIDTAKQLAMVENNDKGREIRKYFIECERRAKAAAAVLVARASTSEASASAAPFDPATFFEDPAAMRVALLTYTERLIKAEDVIKEQAPKVAALNRIAQFTDGALCITDAAKTLQVKPKVLFTWLQGHDWIYRRQSSHWIAYQPRLKQGYLEHKICTIQRRNLDGILEDKIVEQVRITPKGLTYLSTVFCNGVAVE